jgi:hypothetical protein
MSELFVVHGCGDLAWARRTRTRFGEDWITGRLPGLQPLQEGDEPAVSLADELDALSGSRPSRDAPQIRVEIHHERDPRYSLLPSWEELAAAQARQVTADLRGSGVLVTPRAWAEVDRGRVFLQAWRQQGWRWAALEEVLDLQFPAGSRHVSGGSLWLRIHDQGGRLTVANGAEAACALEVAPKVLDAALAAVDGSLARDWRSREERHCGWFTRQQIARGLAQTLREGRRSVELGGSGSPLFRFSSPDAASRFGALAGIRAAVDLPPLAATIWWEQVADSGFFKGQTGAANPPPVRWEARETLLLGNPGSDGASPAEIRSLHTYLRFNGRPLRLADPVALTEALTADVDLDPLLARQQEPAASSPEEGAPLKADILPEPLSLSPGEEDPGLSAPLREGGAQPAGEPVAAVAAGEPAAELTAADPLAAFRPDHLYLDEPHRSGHLKVWLEDKQITPENVLPARLEQERRGYRIQGGVTVPRGAVVRIDFEPE